MTPRTQDCDKKNARSRLEHARAQLTLAELHSEADSGAERKAAASSAVIAGIAASDAACCAALGEYSRSQNHLDAAALLAEISPGGTDAANTLKRLIGLKDQAQYGLDDLSGQKLLAAQRQARKLVDFADTVINR